MVPQDPENNGLAEPVDPAAGLGGPRPVDPGSLGSPQAGIVGPPPSSTATSTMARRASTKAISAHPVGGRNRCST